MNAEDIRKRVAQVREVAGDSEAAHGMEDRLWRDVLTAIARGRAEDPSVCAREALKTTSIKFERWRA